MERLNFARSGLLLVAIIALAGPRHADGQETLRCISISTIDRTEVIDGQRIAFYLTRDRIYLNTLDQSCHNLDRGQPFSYSTSTGQLCSLDSITVLEDFGGFSRGASCGLGVFNPTDEDSLSVLRGELEPIEIDVQEIEVDEGDESAEDGEGGEADGDEGEAEADGGTVDDDEAAGDAR